VDVPDGVRAHLRRATRIDVIAVVRLVSTRSKRSATSRLPSVVLAWRRGLSGPGLASFVAPGGRPLRSPASGRPCGPSARRATSQS
jgi:hypothetical protein